MNNFTKVINGVVIDMTLEEIEQYKIELAENIEREKVILSIQQDFEKKNAYQKESDPLFFKWQAGEITQDEWLNKRAEIKSRFNTQ